METSVAYKRKLLQLESHMQHSEENSLQLCERISRIDKQLEETKGRSKETLQLIASSEVSLRKMAAAQSETKRKLSDLYSQLISFSSLSSSATTADKTAAGVAEVPQMGSLVLWWKAFAFNSLCVSNDMESLTIFEELCYRQLDCEEKVRQMIVCPFGLLEICSHGNCPFHHSLPGESTACVGVKSWVTNARLLLRRPNAGEATTPKLGSRDLEGATLETLLYCPPRVSISHSWKRAISSILWPGKRLLSVSDNEAMFVSCFHFSSSQSSRSRLDVALAALKVLKQLFDDCKEYRNDVDAWITFFALVQTLPREELDTTMLVQYFHPELDEMFMSHSDRAKLEYLIMDLLSTNEDMLRRVMFPTMCAVAQLKRCQPEAAINLLCKWLKISPIFDVVAVDMNSELVDGSSLPRDICWASLLLWLLTGRNCVLKLLCTSAGENLVMDPALSSALQQPLLSASSESDSQLNRFSVLVKRCPKFDGRLRNLMIQALSEVSQLTAKFENKNLIFNDFFSFSSSSAKLSLPFPDTSSQAVCWCVLGYLKVSKISIAPQSLPVFMNTFSPELLSNLYLDWNWTNLGLWQSQQMCGQPCNDRFDIWDVECICGAGLEGIIDHREIACLLSGRAEKWLLTAGELGLLANCNYFWDLENFFDALFSRLPSCYLSIVLNWILSALKIIARHIQSEVKSVEGLIFWLLRILQRSLVLERQSSRFSCWPAFEFLSHSLQYHTLLQAFQFLNDESLLSFDTASSVVTHIVECMPNASGPVQWLVNWIRSQFPRRHLVGTVFGELSRQQSTAFDSMQIYPASLLFDILEELFWAEELSAFRRLYRLLQASSDSERDSYISRCRAFLIIQSKSSSFRSSLSALFPGVVTTQNQTERLLDLSTVPDVLILKLTNYLSSKQQSRSLDLSGVCHEAIIGSHAHPLTLASLSALRKTPLQDLSLSQNNLSCLPPAIGLLRKLNRLDLSWNQLSYLPEDLNLNCSELVILNLSHNMFRRLPPVVNRLSNLKELCLHHNFIEYLPLELKNLSWLESLDISENLIKSVPSGLQNLKYFRK